MIRTWRRQDDDEREIEELSVFAVDGLKACTYAAVDIHVASANEAALARAEEAAGCGLSEARSEMTSPVSLESLFANPSSKRKRDTAT